MNILGYSLLALLLASSVISNPTQAEIFKCISADGVAKFSNRPCPKSELKGNSEPYQFYEQLKSLIAENQNLIRSMGGDTQSIMNCQAEAKQELKAYPALHKKAKELSTISKAYSPAVKLIEECVGCSYRHLSYCENADKELDRVKTDLVNSQFVYKPPAWMKKY